MQWIRTGLEAVIVPLNNRASLARVTMDWDAFQQYTIRYPENNCNHLFFTDMGNGVLAARCLMENNVEDPATGSANGNLAAYLLQYHSVTVQDISYTVIQGEDMGRKSVLEIRAARRDDAWLIEVGGQCFLVAHGFWE